VTVAASTADSLVIKCRADKCCRVMTLGTVEQGGDVVRLLSQRVNIVMTGFTAADNIGVIKYPQRKTLCGMTATAVGAGRNMRRGFCQGEAAVVA